VRLQYFDKLKNLNEIKFWKFAIPKFKSVDAMRVLLWFFTAKASQRDISHLVSVKLASKLTLAFERTNFCLVSVDEMMIKILLCWSDCTGASKRC